MVKNFENITNKLDQVIFHDIPVKGLYVETDKKLLVRIDYYLYVDRKKDYDGYSLVFSEIESMKFQEFSFTEANDLEIVRFDYKVINELIQCKILFLTGFSQPSIDLEIDCRNIEIIKNEHNIN